MKKSKGFTLIELLVVIAIIGILAAIVLVSLSGARNRAKDARIISDMQQIRNVLAIHESERGNYNAFDSESEFSTLVADIADQGGNYYYATADTDSDGDADNACMVAGLNSGDYWCIDSNLFSANVGSTTPATCDTTSSALCQ